MNKRESFTNRLGFILACIGSAVGMGNIWMFPTRVSLYGGGSYLIPYFIFVVLIASTGVIGEMSFGRGTRSGPIDAFGAACESRGKRKVGETLGFIPVLGSLAMAIGYTVVMGWILKYMIGTFTGSTLAPKINGPKILPSNCCNTMIQMINTTNMIGSSISANNAPGTAPINGPKNGMIFVTPTTTLISTAYRMCTAEVNIKHMIPMIQESKILPLINPPNTTFAYEHPSMILLPVFLENRQ